MRKKQKQLPGLLEILIILYLFNIINVLGQTTCNNGLGRVLYERLPNQQLQGFDDDVVRDTAPPFRVLEKCQDLCLRDRTAANNLVRACTSFDFQPGSRIASFSGTPEYEESTCYLTREQAAPEGIGNLMLVPNSVHFTEICLTSNRPERECPSRRYVFERHPRKKLKLPVSDIKEITAANRSDCEDKCLNEFSFVCRSANYDSSLRSCTLSRFTRRTHPELMEDDPNTDYLENTCLNAERRCDGLAVFVKEENKRLGGPFEVDIFNNMTLEECQSVCMRAEKYFCRSVEFDDQTKQCILSEEDSVSQKDDISISSSPTHHFYDLVCLDNQRGSDYPDNSVTSHLFSNGRRPDTAFQRYRNSRLGGEFHSEITGRSLSECLDECLRQTSFQCRSAVYSDRFRTCRLSRYNQRDGMRIIYDADYDYYENLMPNLVGGDGDDRPSTRPDPMGSTDWRNPGYPGSDRDRDRDRDRYPDDRYPTRYPPSNGGYPDRYPTSARPDYDRYPSGGDRHPMPGGDRYPTSGGDRYPTTAGDRYPTGGDRYPTSGGDRYPASGGDRYPASGADRYPMPGMDRYPMPGMDDGRYPMDRYPMDRYPMDRYPMDRYPMDRPPTDRYPMDRYPTDRYPMDRYPINKNPMDRYPPDMYPPVNDNRIPGEDRYPERQPGRYPDRVNPMAKPPIYDKEGYPDRGVPPKPGLSYPDSRFPPDKQTPLDSRYPERTYPNDPRYPDRGYPDRGYPDRGYPDRGYPDRGYPDRGYPDRGYPMEGRFPPRPNIPGRYPNDPQYPENRYPVTDPNIKPSMPGGRYPVSENRFPIGNERFPVNIYKYGNRERYPDSGYDYSGMGIGMAVGMGFDRDRGYIDRFGATAHSGGGGRDPGYFYPPPGGMGGYEPGYDRDRGFGRYPVSSVGGHPSGGGGPGMGGGYPYEMPFRPPSGYDNSINAIAGDGFGGMGPARPYSPRCDEGENFKQVASRHRMRRTYIRRSMTVPTLVHCQRECVESRDFTCRSFNYKDPALAYESGNDRDRDRDGSNCELSDRDTRDMDLQNPMMFDTGTYDYYEKSGGRNGVDGECLDVSQTCNEDGMEFTLRTPEGFVGRIYTYGFYDRCFFRGNGGTVNVLRISGPQGYPECGTQRYGDTMTNIVVVQFSDNVQTGRDKRFNLTCLFRGPGESVVTSGYIGAGSGSPIPIEYLPAENTLSSKVRLMILYQGRPTTTIAVGDPLTFRLESQDGYNHLTDIFATNVIARDPYSGRSIQLIDRFGCPVDPYVFPELDRLREGDMLEARFNAFKIPESNFLVFEATVRTCREGCQPAYCPGPAGRSEPSFGRKKRSTNGTIIADGILNVTENNQMIDKNATFPTITVNSTDQNQSFLDDNVSIDSNNDKNDNPNDETTDSSTDFPEHVREMIEVFESREEMEQEAMARKLVVPQETVCLTPSEYHSLISAVILLMILLLSITLAAGLAYRRYWTVMTKNRAVDRNSPINSFSPSALHQNLNLSTSSHQFNASGRNNSPTRLRPSLSLFSGGLQKTFATGNLSRMCQIPVMNPIRNNGNSTEFDDPSEPIYTDPSLFERSRSLRSIAVRQSNEV